MALTIKEAEAFLADLKLTDDERKQMETILGSDERQNAIKSGVHAKAEADRLMTQARQAEAAATAKEAEANEQINGWLKWYQEENPKVTQYQSEAQAERQKALMLSNYLVAQGIDPATAIAGYQPAAAPPPPPAPAAFSWEEATKDPKFNEYFVPRKEAQETAQTILQLNDIQHRINLRNRKLFGTDIDDFATLRNEAMAAKKPLEEYANEKLGFAKKEGELAEKALEDRAQKMADEKYQALVSRTGLPQPSGEVEAPIFSDAFGDNTKVSEGDADRAAIQRAVAFVNANPNHASDMADFNI